MKATFFYDIRFLEKDGKYYSHYGVNDKMFDRYLSIFDDFTYIGRLEKLKSQNEMFICDKNQIHNINIRTFNNNYSDVKVVVKAEVEKSEFCIIRLPSIAGVIAQKECERQNKPYIIEVVGNILEALWYHSLKTKIFALPIHLLMKHTIRNSKFVCYITDTYLQKKYPTNYRSFPGVANVSLKPLSENTLKNRIKNIQSKKDDSLITVGLIGSLDVNYKGHNTAIKAIEQVKKRYPNIKLKLLGQGNPDRWKEICRKHGVLNNVEFCGSLPGGEAVMEWLDNIDIYIQPSITEGHGRSAVEAMSRGCITFASKTGGLVDSIDKKYLFKKKSYSELAELIINSIENENFAIEVINSSFNRAKRYEESKVENRRRKAINEAIDYWR